MARSSGSVAPCTGPERNFAEFETGNLTLSVMNAEAMGLEHHRVGNAVALHVDDVGAARTELEGRGVAFQGETFDTGVCHMAFFAGSRRQRAHAPPPLRAAAARLIRRTYQSQMLLVFDK
jgi:hypothetical protein